ncbi:AMP-binding protein, partial [Halochromatium sp.]
MIRNAARDYASNIALSVVLPTGAHHSLTFAEVDALSDAFAVYLRKELALAPGSRVAVQMPNSLAYAVTAFGALKAACVLVNINPLYTPYETEAQIKDAEASVLILIDLFADRISSQTIQSLDTIIVASVVDFFPPTKRKLIQLIIKYVQKKVPKVHYRHRTLHQAVRKDQAQVASCASDLEQAVDHIDRDTLAML